MVFREIGKNKKDYMPLLLLADESEKMVLKYLERGRMFIIENDDAVVGEIVTTDEGDGILEIKNIAILPEYSRKGYGRALIEYVETFFRSKYSILQVGTGESPLTMPFYEKCGFSYSHRISNFFIDNYDHPIFEEGIQLKDMVYLRKKLQ